MENSNIESKNFLKNGFILKKITAFLFDTIGFIQYQLASKRNYYPCKFVGEKPNENELHNTIILYKIKGKKEVLEIPIKELLENIQLLVKFHQKDTLKFGAIAMSAILFRENKEVVCSRFNEIKQKMLDSTNSEIISEYNYYPCKLVGNKTHAKKTYGTTILYTIKGKREIFEVPIIELLEDVKFLEKFHPITTVKFGAIAMGDTLFGNNQNSIK